MSNGWGGPEAPERIPESFPEFPCAAQTVARGKSGGCEPSRPGADSAPGPRPRALCFGDGLPASTTEAARGACAPIPNTFRRQLVVDTATAAQGLSLPWVVASRPRWGQWQLPSGAEAHGSKSMAGDSSETSFLPRGPPRPCRRLPFLPLPAAPLPSPRSPLTRVRDLPAVPLSLPHAAGRITLQEFSTERKERAKRGAGRSVLGRLIRPHGRKIATRMGGGGPCAAVSAAAASCPSADRCLLMLGGGCGAFGDSGRLGICFGRGGRH